MARTTRTLPTAIRRAVIPRDAGCAFPGCSVPARWCDIHHIIHWDDNGSTRTTPSIWFPIGCESASNGKLLRSHSLHRDGNWSSPAQHILMFTGCHECHALAR